MQRRSPGQFGSFAGWPSDPFQTEVHRRSFGLIRPGVEAVSEQGRNRPEPQTSKIDRSRACSVMRVSGLPRSSIPSPRIRSASRSVPGAWGDPPAGILKAIGPRRQGQEAARAGSGDPSQNHDIAVALRLFERGAPGSITQSNGVARE